MERSHTCKGGWEGLMREWENQFLKINFDGFLNIRRELVVAGGGIGFF